MAAQPEDEVIGRVVPRRLGRYELLARVGQGATGWVFKARRDDGRVVALKVLSPKVIRDKASVERFFREARAAALMNHPNVVAALEAGLDSGFCYIAMEFVEGESLRSVLRRGPLPEEQALRVAAEVAKALDHAARSGIVHRDIKPDNILLARDGRVRVTDFGLAKAVGKKIDADARRFLGTPAYTSPEQIRSEPNIDSRADIFSLGVTLFEMLTGRLPFTGGNPVAIAAAVLSEPLPPIRRLRPDLSIATARLVERMTAKDPDQRFGDPGELLKAIATAQEAARSQAARAPARSARPRRRRSMIPTYVAIVLVVAANAAVLAFLYPRLIRRAAGPAPSSSDKVTTATTTSEVARAGRGAMGQLASAATAIERFSKSNPRAYASMENQLSALLRRYPPQALTELPPEGRRLVEDLKARLEGVRKEGGAAATRELATRESRADRLLQEGKIDAAVSAIETFPRELEVESIAPKLEEARKKVRQRAREIFEKKDAAGQELFKQGRYEEARALYEQFADSRLEGVSSRARDAMAAIDEGIAEAKARATREAALLYRSVAQKVLDRLAARDYKEADRILVEALVDPKLSAHRQKLKDLQWLGNRAAEVWAYAGFGLKNLQPGETLRVGGIACRFVSFEGESLRVKFGDISATRRLRDLTTADLVALAVRGYGAVTPERELRVGLFLLAERDYDGARARIEAAKGKGADVSRALGLLERLARRDCPTCGGTGFVPCPNCDGKGYVKRQRVRCPDCGGHGFFVCRRCGGRGRIRCTNCGGRGRVGRLPCPVCGGTGRQRCPDCGGDGRIRCVRCDGRGYLVRTIPCPKCKGEGKITCPQCKGRGTIAPPEIAPPPGATRP